MIAETRTEFLVASSLDNALVAAGAGVTKRTRRAITRLCSGGGRFVLVTTRPLRSALELARQAGAQTLVCSGGGVVFDPWRERLLAAKMFSVQESRRLAAILRGRLDDVRLAFDSLGGCELDEDFRIGWADSPGLSWSERAEVSGPVTKVMVQSDSVPVAILAEKVRREIASMGAVAIPAPGFVDVLPVGVDHASHLRSLCRQGKASAATTVAFGAVPADLPLLDWSDIPVAMADADLESMDVAGYLAGPHDEEGVAEFIERLLGKQSL
ncbi:HAD family hydrolase [Saccharopolyspora erythraea]|uniref:HAD family hydrolase n=1 Tax=Saccharopolyspora erythraea TaxID=1836 RepID=UPI0012F9EA5C|nr:HAD family hydrolase [Saccharopolyspora erythraea]QRK88492.1 HAD family phosphatase [Saccharopolyspora erythraea]